MSGDEQRHANDSELHRRMHPKTLAIAPKIRTAKFELSINMKTAQVLSLEAWRDFCLGRPKPGPPGSSGVFALRGTGARANPPQRPRRPACETLQTAVD